MALFSILLSFVLVAFGQPAWVTYLSPLAAALGYAILWDALRKLPYKGFARALFAGLWYAAVQLVHLSWMTATEFHGVYILIVYVSLALAMGLLFALFSALLLSKKSFSWLRIGALAGLWTLVEWLRFHILCGFSWNPAGLALAAYPLSMQLAAVTGILGLTFWVMLTNLVGLKELWRTNHQKGVLRWAAVALFPYVFGAVFWAFHEKKGEERPASRVALVQTGLLPRVVGGEEEVHLFDDVKNRDRLSIHPSEDVIIDSDLTLSRAGRLRMERR